MKFRFGEVPMGIDAQTLRYFRLPTSAELARIHAELRQLTRGQTVIVIPRRLK